MMDYNGNDVYKGLFYNVDNEDEQQFYEGGAHFSYIELYEELIQNSKFIEEIEGFKNIIDKILKK